MKTPTQKQTLDEYWKTLKEEPEVQAVLGILGLNIPLEDKLAAIAVLSLAIYRDEFAPNYTPAQYKALAEEIKDEIVKPWLATFQNKEEVAEILTLLKALHPKDLQNLFLETLAPYITITTMLTTAAAETPDKKAAWDLEITIGGETHKIINLPELAMDVARQHAKPSEDDTNLLKAGWARFVSGLEAFLPAADLRNGVKDVFNAFSRLNKAAQISDLSDDKKRDVTAHLLADITTIFTKLATNTLKSLDADAIAAKAKEAERILTTRRIESVARRITKLPERLLAHMAAKRLGSLGREWDDTIKSSADLMNIFISVADLIPRPLLLKALKDTAKAMDKATLQLAKKQKRSRKPNVA